MEAYTTSQKPRTGLETSIESFLQDKVRTLASILAEIEISLTERHELSRSILEDLDHHYAAVKSELFLLEPGNDPGVEGRRLEVKKQLGFIRAEKRREAVQAWQDKERLLSEHRGWMKQYKDLNLRSGFFKGV